MFDITQKGIFAPGYYKEFLCIADRCQHNCCTDWEICIDDETYEKYKKMEDIFDTVREDEEGPCFVLGKDGRCPHLNCDGLCNIILTHGEGYLSDICQNHPRFYNVISNTRMEAGLGLVCEEACRLILEDANPFPLIKLGELEDSGFYEGDAFAFLQKRDSILSFILSEGDYDAKVAAMEREYGLPVISFSDQWIKKFLSLEILDVQWERCLQSIIGRPFRMDSDIRKAYNIYCKRLLIYFVYRHVSRANSWQELCARIAFAILSVETIRTLFENEANQTPESFLDIARRYSAEIEYSEENTEKLVSLFMN